MSLNSIFTSKKILVFVFLLFILLITLLSEKLWLQNNDKVVVRIPVENCFVQKETCIVNFNEFKVGISFAKDVYYLKKFNISVFTERKSTSNINSIQVDFKMKSMDMGVNRFMLTKRKLINKKQLWDGIAILPICVTGRADWFSELVIEANKTKYILTFPFQVKQSSL